MEAQTRPPKYAVGKKSLRQSEAKPAVNAKVEKTDYSKMTVGELKAAAKDKGISGYTSLKKAELIAALNK